MKRLGLTSVVLVFLLCLVALLSLPQSSVGQTTQANLALLREFTLEPGGPAFTYEFTAAEDNPYTFVAAWGSVVGLRLSLTSEGFGPLVQEGSPASLSFQAKKGVKYTLKVSAAGQLPVTSVGQLQGGFQPGLVIAPVITSATPMPLPGPESPVLVVQMLEPGVLLAGATPMPLPGPILPALMTKLTMPMNLEATLALLKAGPTGSTVLLSGPIDQTPPPPSDDAVHVRAPKMPESAAEIDWKTGFRLRLWSEPPSYVLGEHQYSIATIYSRKVIVAQGPGFVKEQAMGLARLNVSAYDQSDYTLLSAVLELPPGPGTYVLRFRLADSAGLFTADHLGEWRKTLFSFQLRAFETWSQTSRVLPLTLATNPPGFVAILTVNAPNQSSTTPVETHTGMRVQSVFLDLVYADFVHQNPDYFVFGGIDISRLN